MGPGAPQAAQEAFLGPLSIYCTVSQRGRLPVFPRGAPCLASLRDIAGLTPVVAAGL